ncbi:MAG: type 2 lanthipeptide synthetase LanM [Alcanivorax sp.]|uniref:type 2 lanthipeptide synthetase LanM n=1 Tax=Alcanivorax sp. TaxID=1872427 RepID=UPI003DA74FF6
MRAEAFQRIVSARTLTLAEHLCGDYLQPDMGDGATRVAERRLKHWQGILDRFSAGNLHKRLLWDNIKLSNEVLLDRLRPGTLRSDVPLPEWTNTAWRIAKTVQKSTSNTQAFSYLDSNDPVPFESLFLPIIESQRKELISACPRWDTQFSDQAKDCLCRDLLQRLSANLSRCLEHEFSLFRLKQAPSNPQGTALYQDFLNNLANGDIQPFLLKYAYATRLASLTLEQWLNNQIRLSRHLDDDRQALAHHFGVPTSARVETVSTGLSDRHHNGQSVTKTVFSGGITLYYKPRGMVLESRIAELCGELDASLTAIVPPVISRHDHGWVTEITGQTADPDRYYAQAGKIIFAAWMFAGTDLHDENVMPSTDGPVIIDAEMLASPIPLSTGSSSSASMLASTTTRAEDATVLRSGLLPRWLSYGDGTAIQISGISAGKKYLTDLKTHCWVHINTDRMALQTEWISVDTANKKTSLPPASDYEAAILEGFCSLVEPARRLAARPQWEHTLATLMNGCEVRFLVRDTTLYATLEQTVRHPRHALTLLDAEIEQECLAATFLSHNSRPHVWPFLAEEKASLQNGDIPHFVVAANQTHWQTRDGQSIELFARSGLDEIRERFSQISDTDIALQSSLIKSCLFTTREDFEVKPTPQAAKGVAGPGSPLNPLHVATRIGDALLNMAIKRPEAHGKMPTWIAAQSLGARHPSTVRALEASLYDGQAGMGLFFAALAQRTQAPRFQQASENIFRGLLAKGEHWNEELDNRHGGLVGRPSLLFALHHAITLAELDSLRPDHKKLCTSLIENTFTPSGQSADWISGLAGAIAAMTPCLPLPQHQAYLDSLLEQFISIESSSLLAGWPEKGKTPAISGQHFMTGAGHGIAGPILSLCQLLEPIPPADRPAPALRVLTECSRFLDAQWVEEERNWKASAEPTALADSDGWAHGSAGILVALGALQRITGSAQACADKAAARLRERPLMQWDHLAMGNCGLIETWLLLGEQDQASQLANRMLGRYQSQQSWAIPGGESMQPAMFTGIAGIGYSLLRLEQPTLLPSLLSLQ